MKAPVLLSPLTVARLSPSCTTDRLHTEDPAPEVRWHLGLTSVSYLGFLVPSPCQTSLPTNSVAESFWGVTSGAKIGDPDLVIALNSRILVIRTP